MLRKPTWIMLAVSVLIVLPLRFYSVFALQDPQTGFYADHGTIAGIGIILCLAMGAVMAILARKQDKSDFTYRPQKNLTAGVTAAALGIVILIYSVQSVIRFTLGGNGGQQTGLTAVMAIVGFFSAMVLFAVSGSFCGEGKLLSEHPIVGLAVPIWYCLDLVVLFITYTASSGARENFFDIFSAALFLLFFFNQSKTLSGIEPQSSCRAMYIFGLPAVLVTFAGSLPAVVGTVLRFSVRSSIPLMLQVCNVVAAVYVLAVLITTSMKIYGELQGKYFRNE